jgi:NTP pyrophosphatase (non-canonical NTP hydrolase)
MAEYPARALASCRDCPREDYVSGVVGVSAGTPDGPGEADFYPDIEGSMFEKCEMCRWPRLDIDDVRSHEEERRLSRQESFALIEAERERQIRKWGGQWEPGSISPELKLAILVEEVGEVAKEILESGGQETEELRKELVQVGAVTVAWLESLEVE